jgi:hypothetical protein
MDRIAGLVKERMVKTKTIISNLNPVWNEEVVFALTTPEQRSIMFQVKDANIYKKSELMASTGISLSEVTLHQGKPVDLILNLYHESDKHHGHLHVQLTALDFSIENEEFDPVEHNGEINMSHLNELGHGRSLKSIVTNTITPEEDAKLDKLFDWVHVDDVYDQLDTGDILLKSGVGTFSMFIQLGLRCMYSHVAVIIRDPSDELKAAFKVPDDIQGNVFVLEADSELFVDPSRKTGGVQFMELRQWLRAYAEESG